MIPDENVQAAFHDAVLGLDLWNKDGEGYPVTLDGQLYTVSAIAGMSRSLPGDMPNEICEILEFRAATFSLALKDHSYAAGAACLSQILDARKAKLARLNRGS